MGTPVYAATDGKVTTDASAWFCETHHNETLSQWGAIAITDSEDSHYRTCYLHLSEILVSDGEVVKQGQLIGYSGKTAPRGVHLGPHLHFQALRDGVSFDPYGWDGSGSDPYTRTQDIDLWPYAKITSKSDKVKFIKQNPPEGKGKKFPEFSPGEAFTTEWTVENTGSTTWQGVYLRYLSGSLSTSRQNQPITHPVDPGSDYTFYVPMRAPTELGTYKEDWEILSSDGNHVGTLWVVITVTSDAGPGITSFSADPNPIKPGTATTFKWTILGASHPVTCTLDPGDGSKPISISHCANTTSKSYTYTQAADNPYIATLSIKGTDANLTTKVTVSSTTCTDPINISDANLKAAIENQLGISTSPTCAQMQNLTELEAEDSNIQSLEGLQYASNLAYLDLSDNQVSDISPLSGLTKLTHLDLRVNQISNINPLVNLTNLAYLVLSGNQISNFNPLSGLTNLTALGLDVTQISDLNPLSGLTKLMTLTLSYNQISNLSPLSNLTSLTDLELNNNQISDIQPLVDNSDLGSGDYVDVSHNCLDLSGSSAAMNDINTLLGRGVDLRYAAQNDCASSSAPTINSFSANPPSINAGDASTLSWNVSGATSLLINNGVGDVTGQTSVTVTPSATTTYTLTASNGAGSSVPSTATVTVSAPSGNGAVFQMPTSGTVTQGFASFNNDIDYHGKTYPHDRHHTGLDIHNDKGTPVYAVADGNVVTVDYSKGWGDYIIIDHGDVLGDGHDLYSFYGHMNKTFVNEGPVKRGDRIGSMGKEGVTTGVNLHFELRNFGTVCPSITGPPCGYEYPRPDDPRLGYYDPADIIFGAVDAQGTVVARDEVSMRFLPSTDYGGVINQVVPGESYRLVKQVPADPDDPTCDSGWDKIQPISEDTNARDVTVYDIDGNGGTTELYFIDTSQAGYPENGYKPYRSAALPYAWVCRGNNGEIWLN